MYDNEREMKGWEFSVGDKVYVWDRRRDDIKLDYQQDPEPIIGNIINISDLHITIESVIDGGHHWAHIDDVWRVGEGPVKMKEIEKEEDAKVKADYSVFDLEQSYMNCWTMVDDVRNIAEANQDNELADLLMALVKVYEFRFDKGFKDFEAVCKEFHRRGKK